MPENPADQGEACRGGQGTTQRRDEASQWRRVRLKGPLRRFSSIANARPAEEAIRLGQSARQWWTT